LLYGSGKESNSINLFIYSPVTSVFYVLKYHVKYFLYKLGLAGWIYRRLFRIASQKNRHKNARYLATNPGTALPGDLFLFETYQLDYRKFIEDGRLAAEEIIEWTKPFLPHYSLRVLDWGCGAARICRHLPPLLPDAMIFGCDTNEFLISENKKQVPGIVFSTINGFPPLLYADSYFDLVYGFSVLTHIDAGMQENWLKELHRITKPDGIVLVTTHGAAFLKQLIGPQKKRLKATGIYTQSYPLHGHRMMTTYHDAQHFKKMLAPFFSVKIFFDGSMYPAKAGGQDLWILERMPNNK